MKMINEKNNHTKAQVLKTRQLRNAGITGMEKMAKDLMSNFFHA